MTTDELFAECQERREGLTLRHGRWYAATLRKEDIVILRARKCLPTWESYWILIPERDDRPYEYDGGTWLLLRGDGGLDHDGSMEPDDADPGDRVHAEGLTLDDLVPADDRARAAWRALHGDAAPCPRCGASRERPHHPLCHTADGVPLFPTFGAADWREHVEGDLDEWEADGAFELGGSAR